MFLGRNPTPLVSEGPVPSSAPGGRWQPGAARTHLWTGTPRGCTGSSAGQTPPSCGRSSGPRPAAGSSTGTAWGEDRACVGTGGDNPCVRGFCSQGGCRGLQPSVRCRLTMPHLCPLDRRECIYEKKKEKKTFLFKRMVHLFRLIHKNSNENNSNFQKEKKNDIAGKEIFHQSSHN